MLERAVTRLSGPVSHVPPALRAELREPEAEASFNVWCSEVTAVCDPLVRQMDNWIGVISRCATRERGIRLDG